MKKSKQTTLTNWNEINETKIWRNFFLFKKIIEELEKLNYQHKKHVLVISLDSFYKNLNTDELFKAERGDHNLDHPESFDEDLAYRTLIDLIDGIPTWTEEGIATPMRP